MILEIDTSKYNEISLRILDVEKVLEKKAIANKSQSEKLLPLIDKFLLDNNYSKETIDKIIVENEGSSFTALRIGVITANTLAYALGIAVKARDNSVKNIVGITLVEPKYNREPNIY